MLNQRLWSMSLLTYLVLNIICILQAIAQRLYPSRYQRPHKTIGCPLEEELHSKVLPVGKTHSSEVEACHSWQERSWKSFVTECQCSIVCGCQSYSPCVPWETIQHSLASTATLEWQQFPAATEEWNPSSTSVLTCNSSVNYPCTGFLRLIWDQLEGAKCDSSTILLTVFLLLKST